MKGEKRREVGEPPGSWSQWSLSQLNKHCTRCHSFPVGFLRNMDPPRTMTLAARPLSEATILILVFVLQVSVEGTAESHPDLAGVGLLL